MNWQSVNFDWNRAKAFLVTAEEGSLSAAARALKMSQPTLGRQVSALEHELGVVLFERSGHKLILTSSGEDLLEHIRVMGDAASLALLSAEGSAQNVEGKICISASEVYSAFVLPPIVAKLRREAPKLQIEIVANNDTSDLRRREADIALRHFQPSQPDLIAKKVGDDSARLYAAASYLDTLGEIHCVEDLKGLEFVASSDIDSYIRIYQELGVSLTKDNFFVVSDNHYTQWEYVRQGLGIGIAPDKLGDNEPRVQRVLPDLSPIYFPVFLTTHRELRTSRKVRVVFDLLYEELSKTSAVS